MLTQLTDAGSGNMLIGVTLANADHALKVVIRYVDDDNYFQFQALNRTSAELWVKEAGGWTRLAATLDVFGSGDRFEVRAVGTRLCVSRNGQFLLAVDDGRFQAATVAGLADADPAAVTDFAVASLDGPPPPPVLLLGPIHAYDPDAPLYSDNNIP